MKKVRFSPRARKELDAAARRYEDDRPGLGKRFYAAVNRATRLLARFPEAGPLYPGVESRGIRRIRVTGFPFLIVYDIVDDLIYVGAVAHTDRQPHYWQR